MDSLPAMHQGHAGSVPPEIQGGLRGGVLSAHHNHVAVVVGVGLAIIVKDLGQVFAGNSQPVGQIVVAGGHNHFAGAVVVDVSGAIGRGNAEVPVLAGHGLDPAILVNVQVVMFGHSPVVLEGLPPRGLRIGGGEGNVADLEQLGRGEKHHVRRIVVDRVDQAALLDHQHAQADLLRLNPARQTGGASANDDDIGARL